MRCVFVIQPKQPVQRVACEQIIDWQRAEGADFTKYSGMLEVWEEMISLARFAIAQGMLPCNQSWEQIHEIGLRNAPSLVTLAFHNGL